MRVDDEAPMHVDRCDCGMINPQARRLLRLKAGRTTTNGLNDRVAIPKKDYKFLRYLDGLSVSLIRSENGKKRVKEIP